MSKYSEKKMFPTGQIIERILNFYKIPYRKPKGGGTITALVGGPEQLPEELRVYCGGQELTVGKPSTTKSKPTSKSAKRPSSAKKPARKLRRQKR